MDKFKIAKNVVEVTAMVVGVANQVKELNVKNKDGQNFFVIPDLTGSDVLKTKDLLEEKGFTVVTTPAIPNKKWIGKRRNEVVQMEPKAGKIATNTIIKLIYVTEEIIDQSDGSVELPILEGLLLDDALELLDKKGLIPSKCLAEPDKKWASKKTILWLTVIQNQVL